ncbi:MAG: hypothetical protein PHQ05_09255 [Sterolibacterium sp.]|nr:hypothetical protein [Sterolibacterium sp.]
MLSKTDCIFALIALSLAAPGYCESGANATPESKSMRTRVDGMKSYYEPGNVKKDGDVVSFKIYSSPSPTSKEEGDEYSINCSTHEMSSQEGKRGAKAWTKPSPLLAGESMYPIAKKLCEWGPGFWQKLTD